jgi:hypothetical protein
MLLGQPRPHFWAVYAVGENGAERVISQVWFQVDWPKDTSRIVRSKSFLGIEKDL